MSWTQADIPDQDGRVAVVTGANGGLGLETTVALAAAGAHVVMAARDPEKAERAEAEVRRRAPGADVEVVPLDLGDLAVVRAAAETICAAHPRVDLLVNNAGVMAMPQRETADGFEMQLGVDHLGHFALTAHLLPSLLRAEAARVVTVSSIARFQGRPFRPNDPHLRGGYGPWRAYAQAKWANLHFGLGLEQHLAAAGTRAQSLVAHPGLSNTDLQATTHAQGGAGLLGRLAVPAARLTGMKPHEGVRPQLRAATDPAARGGELYGPLLGASGPAVRRPVRERDLGTRVAELWEMSQRETGVVLDVASVWESLEA